MVQEDIKKGNDVAAKPQTKNAEVVADEREIPFVKPARVGNFKVWRGRKVIGKGNDKTEIEQINVSTLDGEWHVKIPATFDMYSLIRSLFARSDNDNLIAFFSTMLYTSVIANGYFQHAVTLLVIAFNNPSILKEGDKDHAAFISDLSKLSRDFLEWRKGYDEMIASTSPSEEEMDNDQVIEEMLEEAESEPHPTQEEDMNDSQ